MSSRRSPNDLTHPPTSRQELYDRIRQSSTDKVILEEMIRYGFWPKDAGRPADPKSETARIATLRKELAAARAQAAKLQDIDKLLKQRRTQRMKASREGREQSRQKRILEAKLRAEDWRRRKKREILHLGDGFSHGLSRSAADVARLSSQGLPHFPDAAALAAAMKLTIGQLRFLSYSRRVSAVSHYRRFDIPKKTGGVRRISAPMPRLKAAQHWILEHILDRVAIHDAAHGFRSQRSIVTNAEPHVGADVVINSDLKDFFPSISYRRVLGMFRSLGYAHAIATIFALICTEPRITAVEMDGQTWYVARGERFLPQGAPTSPAVTNIICRRLDARMAGMARSLGFTYTRYADDLTLSGAADVPVGRALRGLRNIVAGEGFTVHPDKTRVMRRGSRHEVTGIVVNDKLSVDRSTLRRFRATLYQIEKDGPTGKTWGSSPDLMAAIAGYANFVNMVSPARGAALVAQVARIIDKHGR